MFIKRIRCKGAKRVYHSAFLVQGMRVPADLPPGRPPKGAKRSTKVVHKTLANLSKLPESLVGLIEAWCRAPDSVRVGDSSAVRMGPCYGVLGALGALAEQIGLVEALGMDRMGRLALFLVLARLAHQGSRLSAARWAEDHAVGSALGLERFDEDDLYAALEWLESRQDRIEATLSRRRAPGSFFLYDVTSSYLEGQHHELGAHGYNRDGKRYKKQVVVGLLTDAEGEPMAVEVFAGNTADPSTFAQAVEKLRLKLGLERVTMVGDRGMIKSAGKGLLEETGFHYVSALSDPQIRAKLKQGVFEMELFDEEPAEVRQEGRRYVLRRNPRTMERQRQRRADQAAKLQRWIRERNAWVETHPRASAAASLRQAQRRLTKGELGRFVKLSLERGRVTWGEDAAARTELERLDGCYVLESDLPVEAATTRQLHERYMSLMSVERDFRMAKTGLLEIRPIFLRKANRTRGHALVTLLALRLARELDRRVAPLGITVQDAVERLGAIRLVSLATPELGLWRLPNDYPPAQQELLALLPKLPTPGLSVKNFQKRRLTNPRKGRPSLSK